VEAKPTTGVSNDLPRGPVHACLRAYPKAHEEWLSIGFVGGFVGGVWAACGVTLGAFGCEPGPWTPTGAIALSEGTHGHSHSTSPRHLHLTLVHPCFGVAPRGTTYRPTSPSLASRKRLQ
jgi:hypothetical protein